MIYLWLDDERKPPSHADSGVVWTWVKNHDDAIKQLQTGEVVFASLDNDLAAEHYLAFDRSLKEGTDLSTAEFKEKTGYDVLCWMEENGVWPEEGVRIHTMNTARKPVMVLIVKKQYGKDFQYQIKGTHWV